MIDCHAHLALPDFDADRAAVLERATAAGVEAVLVVGEDRQENERLLQVCEGDLRLRPCLGLHPDRWSDRRDVIPGPEDIDEVLSQLRTYAPRLAAIGEVGLDRRVTVDPARRASQAEAFRQLVRLALELDLPLNVHSRSAGHHALDLLLGEGARRVLMHAFDGKAHHALRGAEAGYLFSIPPSIVRSRQKEKLVQRLPLSALALESDSPVLGPVRDARNEPANITHSVAAIARIKGISEDEVRQATTANARNLFRLQDSSLHAARP